MSADPIKGWSHDQFVDWALGELILSIGRGEIRSTLFKVLLTYQRWVKLNVRPQGKRKQ